MLNTATLMGRITKDIELRYTQSNKPVASFSIACERDLKDSEGKRPTDFFSIVAWNSTAEFVEKYFSKGDSIIVKGRLQNRDWTDRDGNKRTTTELIADSVYFGQSKKSDDTPTPVRAPSRESFAAARQEFVEMDDDGGLPF